MIVQINISINHENMRRGGRISINHESSADIQDFLYGIIQQIIQSIVFFPLVYLKIK